MNPKNDRYFLEIALEEAELALSENTYPVGAVIVDENGQIVARGRNQVHPAKDVTAHAEVNAIRNGGQAILDAKIQRDKLTMYSTLEPCPMCTGAILFANIKKIVWLLNDDPGFGGYQKIKDTGVFQQKFDRIEVIAEPYEDLKARQKELMKAWELNPNHVTNLRENVKK